MRLRRFRLPLFGAFGAARSVLVARGSRLRTRIILPAVLICLVAGTLPLALVAARPTVHLRGISPGAILGKAQLAELRVRVAAEGARPEGVRVRLDGTTVRTRPRGGTLAVELGDLSHGKHTLAVSARSAFGLARVETARSFTVDTEPPGLEVPEEAWASSFTEQFSFDASATGATRVTANGKPVDRGDGSFRVPVRNPPAEITVTATDRAGNTTEATVPVGVRHPGMRAVHMSAISWTSDGLREPILDMIRQGKIDTVELDIKDENGEVGYDTDVDLAEKIGADKGYYDAEKVIDKLHDMGARVVGRLVCFRDPILAEASWKSGHRSRVIQTPHGSAYSGGYGDFSFTNFANAAVRQYNIDLAAEAAELGFDDVLYDYVRRPDGHLNNMTFPGLEGSPADAITGFVQESTEAVHGHGAFLGLSVFGIAATRPKEVAQDIPDMAEHADYIAPMVYPSHWGPGEYGVARPNDHPYRIVKRSLRNFEKQVEDTGAVVIPWLQDFSLGVSYGADEVRAQIEATRDVGIDSFLLWNAGVGYTPAALRG